MASPAIRLSPGGSAPARALWPSGLSDPTCSRPLWGRVLAVLVLLAAARHELSAIDPPKMFATSVTGTGNLSTWADVAGTGLTGLAAGDAICQARALAAGFSGSTYRAWLSDQNDDAYCRIAGASGRKSANCGDLGSPAGGWTRTDGVVFAGPLAQMTGPDNEVFMPPRFDELGDPVSGLAFTGTFADGTAHYWTCQNWTSANPGHNGAAGSTDMTAGGWTTGPGSGCGYARRLYCFETGRTWSPPPFTGIGRLAFVTSVARDANLGGWPEAGGSATGLAAGDAICRSLASAAGLPVPMGFTAWLSATGISASSRFTYLGPWIRPDGALVATSLADLTDGALATSIHQTESGVYISTWVWTGTTASGDPEADRCLDWTSAANSDLGSIGFASAADGSWSSVYLSQQGCGIAGGHLYCLADEPPAEILSENFESGSTGRWSLTLP